MKQHECKGSVIAMRSEIDKRQIKKAQRHYKAMAATGDEQRTLDIRAALNA